MKHKSFRYGKALIAFIVFLMVMGQTVVFAADSFKTMPARTIPSSYKQYDQIIVKYQDPAFVRGAAAQKTTFSMITNRVSSLALSSGVKLSHHRFMSGDGHVLKLPQKMTLTEAQNIAQNLKNNKYVAYAEPDVRMFPLAIPNDTLYSSQWHYHSSNIEPAGINLSSAWDLTTGLSTTIVAVIDTGIVAHADLTGRTVAGYDFITDTDTANDGDGRDSDPSDPGDWVTSEESSNKSGSFYECEVTDSDWHGTHVAGTIGAHTNNSLGVAGVNWSAKILPVRVLGKCGGYTSDIIDGMRWATGLSVYGAPTNPNPAKILNLSLGSANSCGYFMQNAVSDVLETGVIIVAAAGNESENASNFSPASCSGVISVAALNRLGGLASYSNYGSIVKIAAPGGGGSGGILSTINTGTTSPIASPDGDTYAYYNGTSMATPHVSGVASLILALNPSLTPGQILARIQSSARTFPTGTGSDCTTSTCGAGILNAAAAVAADVGISMTASVEPASTGQALTYTITVVSNGPGPADSVTVTDTLPPGVTFSSATPSQGSCSGGSTITCSLGKIASGSAVMIALTVIPGTAGTISNTASVTTSIYDTNSTNNSASVVTTVEGSTPPGNTTSTGDGGGGGGGCFVATAAYGSYMEKHVNVLREFRDRILMTGSAGRAFVRFYYENSPSVANRISRSETLRLLTRIILMPFVGMAYLTLACGADGILIMLLSMLFAAQIARWGVRNRMFRTKHRVQQY